MKLLILFLIPVITYSQVPYKSGDCFVTKEEHLYNVIKVEDNYVFANKLILNSDNLKFYRNKNFVEVFYYVGNTNSKKINCPTISE